MEFQGVVGRNINQYSYDGESMRIFFFKKMNKVLFLDVYLKEIKMLKKVYMCVYGSIVYIRYDMELISFVFISK